MSHWLFSRFEEFSEKCALVCAQKEHSYGDLLEQIESYDEVLEKEVPRGAITVIVGDYSFGNIALLLALYKRKNIIVPIVPTTERELKEKILESRSTHVIRVEKTGALQVSRREAESSHELIEKVRSSNAAGLILFSSGSTGRPKAMIHNFDLLVEKGIDKRHRKLSLMLFLMFDHIGGINTLLNIFAMTALGVVPDDRKDIQGVCVLVQKHLVNILPASPTFLNLILVSRCHEDYDLSSLKMVTYGTEPMPESLLLRLRGVFPCVKFLQTFGTSETGISQTQSLSSDSLYMKLDDPNVEHKIVDGELWLRSKTQILGYLNDSMEAFTPDGWFKTGDLVEVGQNGYLRVVGRGRELINVGGQKVLPSEIESVLLELDLVKDALVYGEANPITGQCVACEVSLTKPVEINELKKLVRSYCRQRLESYKVPVRIKISSDIKVGSRFKKNRIVRDPA